MLAASQSSSFSESSAEHEVIRLRELDIIVGTLSDIIEPDGEDIILAEIANELIMLPKALSASLWGYMGQKVIVGLITGQIRAERSTTA
jgi:hypothetical protein